MLAWFAAQSALAQSTENSPAGPIALLVVVVAVLIVGIVYRSKQDKKDGPPVLAAAAPAAGYTGGKTVIAPGSFGEIRLHNVDDRTAAMLIAIVADELKTPLNQLRFLSIRQLKEGK